MKKYILGLTFPLILTGCSGFLLGKSNITPPTDLDPNVSQSVVTESWTTSAGASIDKNSGLRFTIGHEGSTIYVVGEKGEVSAIDASSGKRTWSKRTDDLFSGISANNGVLLVGTKNAELVALSATDGSEIWRQPLLGSSISTPVSDGVLAIARTQGGAIQTFDLRTGEENWSYMMTSPELNIRGGAKSVIFDDKILVPNDLGQLGLLSLNDGKVIWGANISKIRNASLSGQLMDIDSEPLVVNDTIYAAAYGTGVSAVNAKTGMKIWASGRGVYSGIAYNDGIVIAVEEDSQIRAFSSRDGAQVWESSKLLGRQLTKPIAIRDRIVVGDFEGYVHVLDTHTGSLLGSTKVGSTKFLPDIREVNGAIILQDQSGKIYRVTI